MNTAIEREKMVYARFRIQGERTLEIPKKLWEEKWEEKVEGAQFDEYELSRIVYEIEKDFAVDRYVDDEWIQYDYCE